MIQLPQYLAERDFSCNDWILWDTVNHQEAARGLRDEMLELMKSPERIPKIKKIAPVKIIQNEQPIEQPVRRRDPVPGSQLVLFEDW